MRTAWTVAALLVLAACAGKKKAGEAGPSGPAEMVSAASAAAVGAAKSLDDERAADLTAYQFLYLPEARRLAVQHPGEWIAIAGGRVATATGAVIEPAKTIEAADAAAKSLAPEAR